MADNERNDRASKPDDVREEGRLGRPDVYPPEEFIGIEGTGEFPEWRDTEEDKPEDRSEDPC